MRRNILDHRRATEHAILKSFPCIHGGCVFCRFIRDNSTDAALIRTVNRAVIGAVDGRYRRLEVYNSGSIFEVPLDDRRRLRDKLRAAHIRELTVEAHWHYRERFAQLKRFFADCAVRVKVGVETFDIHIRENLMRKAMGPVGADEIACYTDAVNLLVGFRGQTPSSVARDVALARTYFKHIDINLIDPRVTPAAWVDSDLAAWFRTAYADLGRDERFRLFLQVKDCDAL